MGKRLATPPVNDHGKFEAVDKQGSKESHGQSHGQIVNLHNDFSDQRKFAKEKAEKRAQSRSVAKRQQAAERIASATEELSSG